MEEGVVCPSLQHKVGRLVIQHSGVSVQLRQLEGEATMPVGGALAVLYSGDENIPAPGHVTRPLISPEHGQ